MVDLSVYQRLVPLAEAQKQNEMQALQKQLIQANISKVQNASAGGGGSTPAALQIANKMFELEKTFKNPQVDPVLRDEALRQYNLIGQAAKTYAYDRGVTYGMGDFGMPAQGSNQGMQLPVGSPQGVEMPQVDVTDQVNGSVPAGLPPVFQNLPAPQISEIPGYSDLMAQRAAAKKGAETQAAKDVELMMQPQIEREKQKAQEVGKSEGIMTAELQERMAVMPQLQQVANRLSALGKLATYTMTGQARDFLLRQAGMDIPDAAVARAEYISIVDNEILPLLRQTFGAQFTQREGESLKITLGDPNKSPQEKDAVLRSFIQTKMETINSQARRVGMPEPYTAEDIQASVSGFQASAQQPAQAGAPKLGDVQDGYMFTGGDPSKPTSWKKVQ